MSALIVARLREPMQAALAAAFLAGCVSTPFAPLQPESALTPADSVSQHSDSVRITASVVSNEEMQALTGLDVYALGIQPVWIEVENFSDEHARVVLASIDDEYFPPYEIAWLTRKSVRRGDRLALERWLFRHRMPREIPAGETAAGFVFTNVVGGTKAFNLDVSLDEFIDHFTFFVPTAGSEGSHMDVAQDDLYVPDAIAVLDRRSLGPAIARHVCCEGDDESARHGVPINVALVGTGVAVHRALLRAGWHEPRRSGERLDELRGHRYLGRTPDGTFVEPRSASGESRELHLWLAPFRLGELPVWVGHTVGTIDAGMDLDPDIDDARLHLLQEFWLGQSLAGFGHVPSVTPVSIDDPALTAAGEWYFTDGRVAVLVVSDKTVSTDATEWLEWEGNAP